MLIADKPVDYSKEGTAGRRLGFWRRLGQWLVKSPGDIIATLGRWEGEEFAIDRDGRTERIPGGGGGGGGAHWTTQLLMDDQDQHALDPAYRRRKWVWSIAVMDCVSVFQIFLYFSQLGPNRRFLQSRRERHMFHENRTAFTKHYCLGLWVANLLCRSYTNWYWACAANALSGSFEI